jgi:TonB family protein
MLPFRYGCALALVCSMCFAAASSSAQTTAGDERMRACVSVLSSGLEGGMSPDDYPDQARRDGRTGATQVQLTVSHTGKMEYASLAHGSGDADLDQAAVQAAQRIFPASSPAPRPCRLGYGFTVTLAVVYKLVDPHDDVLKRSSRGGPASGMRE